MNYDRYADDPVNSPMFDGSETSMGGNGAPSEYAGVPQGFPKPYNMIPAGGGGGCVTEGPFKEYVFVSPLSPSPFTPPVCSLPGGDTDTYSKA